MIQNEQPELIYEFGPFRLQVADYLLKRDGRSVSLQPKVFELLLLLVQQHGHTLEKEQLMQSLWPDVTVEESSLTQLVCQLRKSLGENAAQHQYIETIPKRGYRFVAEVTTSSESFHDFVITSRASTRLLIDQEEELDTEASSADVSDAIAVSAAVPSRQRLLSRLNARVVIVAIVGVAAVGIALLAATLGEWFPRRGLSKSALPFQNADPRKLTASGRAILPALSPDGKTVAYVLDAFGKQAIWVRQIATTSRVQITQPAEKFYLGLTFSPDGQSLYSLERETSHSSGNLYQIPVFGGTARKVLSEVNSMVTFSPDGKEFAFIRGTLAAGDTTLMIASADGSQLKPLLVRKRPDFFARYGLAWSPDGRRIALGVGSSDAQQSYRQVVTVDVADGKETPLGIQSWAEIGELAWLRDGSAVIVNGLPRDATVYAFQLWHLSYPAGTTQKLLREVVNYEGISMSAQSDVMALGRSSRVSKISIAPSGGTANAREILSSMSDNYSESFGLSWTSGGKIVYSSHGSGNSDIWIMDGDGRNQKQLTFDAEREFWPVVSPDDKYIVFTSQGPGGVHLWRIDIDGANRKQLTFGKGESFPSFAPDGKSIFFSSMEPGWPSIGRVSIEGGQSIIFSQFRSARPVVSPDANNVACLYFDNAQSRWTVAVLPATGGEPLRVFPDLPPPKWSLLQWTPDGKGLAYIATKDGVSNIWVQPIEGGSPRQLTQFTEDLIYRFAWSRDGKQIAVDRGTDVKDIFVLSENNS